MNVRTALPAPTFLPEGANRAPVPKEQTMKFMISTYASQQDYDAMTGKEGRGAGLVT